MPRWPHLLLVLCLIAISPASPSSEPVRIFAAASLTDALNDVAANWRSAGHPPPSIAYGASSTLAKQIAAGAPVDLFASADSGWMDYLQARRRIIPSSRINLLGNSLVLIAPKGRPFPVAMEKGFDLAHAFSGRLCIAEPGVVPAGIYAKQSLEALGWWAPLEKRLVGADDVRTALAFVERGECAAGIVYATDANISRKVQVLGVFPQATHQTIVYPFALMAGARPEARAFLDYLRRSAQAAAAMRGRGFLILEP